MLDLELYLAHIRIKQQRSKAFHADGAILSPRRKKSKVVSQDAVEGARRGGGSGAGSGGGNSKNAGGASAMTMKTEFDANIKRADVDKMKIVRTQVCV